MMAPEPRGSQVLIPNLHFVCIILCVNVGINIGVNMVSHRCKHGFNIIVNMQKLALCDIFILTLLCHTYIFLHLVYIKLCEIFIPNLLCHTYIFCPLFVLSFVRFLF